MVTSVSKVRRKYIPTTPTNDDEYFHDRRRPNRTSQARSALLAGFCLLSILFFFKSYSSTPDTKGAKGFWSDLSRPVHDYSGTPQIVKLTMLYGEEINPYYVRALRSHRIHNERWNYGMRVLEEDIVGNYWNKPSYILSQVVAELAKPPQERAEWFMWVDADLVLVNPAVPLETFLPPPDFAHINFLGNRDEKGLNSGTFFLRVCPWAVNMLAKSIALPMFLPDHDLDVQVDQSSMAMVMNETDFSSKGEVLFHPRTWYNDFQFHEEVGNEYQKGDLLIHFPGLEDARWKLMDSWLGKVELSPEKYAVPLSQTRYPKEVQEFWETLHAAQTMLLDTATFLNKDADGPVAARVSEAAEAVRRLVHGTEVDTRPGRDLMKLYKDRMGNLKSLIQGTSPPQQPPPAAAGAAAAGAGTGDAAGGGGGGGAQAAAAAHAPE